tara:strand:+ start:238 stop:462 length:225 start_codon:yes stop_codon:yes gene_type:complete
MDKALQRKRIINDFSELQNADITFIICFFIFAVICAYVFLQMVYERYIKESTVKVSVSAYLAEFQKKQRLQFAG